MRIAPAYQPRFSQKNTSRKSQGYKTHFGHLSFPPPAGCGDGLTSEKEIPYETLRGLPFGHPPFLAFLATAASLAGLVDAPPSLPI